MEKINSKYYDGFEGEPEIQFVCKKEDDYEGYSIWDGYFDQIMRLIKPDEDGWHSLAYHYNVCTGWYEESPWVIDDLPAALRQLETINSQSLDLKTKEVFSIICDMLKEAIANNYEVLISRD